MPFAMIGFVLGVLSFKGDFTPDQWSLSESLGHVSTSGKIYFLFMRLILVVLCMIFARSAAMAFNRWLDKNFDAANPRTAIREIPSGIISANKALIFVIINCIAFIITTWFINLLCFYLSFVALFVILFYSYTKRFTPLCHLVLGLGLSLAPIGAFLAVTGEFHVLPVLFSFVVLTWVSGFDIIYALQDEEFDRSQHLHSIPVWMGKRNALVFSSLLHTFSALLVISIGIMYPFYWLYWIGTVIFCVMLFYQHSIVKPTDLSRVNLAFMTANGFASIGFAVFVILDMILTFNRPLP
jgi:4-hydroxybenzoate polyprenyltransferase